MKKFKRYILLALYIIAATIEFIYSIAHAIVEAVGLKINEGVNALEEYQKAKS